MHDFLNPEFASGVATAIGYGLGVFLTIGVVATLYVFLSGGTAARNWKKSPSQ